MSSAWWKSPSPEARYEAIIALKNKVLLLSRPVQGSLDRNFWDGAPSRTACWSATTSSRTSRETWLNEVADLAVSGDRSQLAYTTAAIEGGHGRRLRVVPTSTKPEEDRAKEPPGRRSGFVDLERVRVLVDPGAEWPQMLREAWRLQPEHFWAADLSGVDWPRVLDRYLPLVERVATRAELSDLIWELQGELGTSHSYEVGGEYRKAPPWGMAHLGAEMVRDASGRWAVARMARGSSWYPREANPLLAPGANVQVGTAILAVNGQAVEPAVGPAPLLANQAGSLVELTVADGDEARLDGAGRRTIVVPTLGDDRPLWYRDWVVSNREKVREATDGRVGLYPYSRHGAFGLVRVPPVLCGRGGARRIGDRRPFQRWGSCVGPHTRKTGPPAHRLGRPSKRCARFLPGGSARRSDGSYHE